MAGPWRLVKRPATSRSGQEKQLGYSCVISIHNWDMGPVELYFQTFCLIICFQNKHVGIAIDHKEIGYPDWTDFRKETYHPWPWGLHKKHFYLSLKTFISRPGLVPHKSPARSNSPLPQAFVRHLICHLFGTWHAALILLFDPQFGRQEECSICP